MKTTDVHLDGSPRSPVVVELSEAEIALRMWEYVRVEKRPTGSSPEAAIAKLPVNDVSLARALSRIAMDYFQEQLESAQRVQ